MAQPPSFHLSCRHQGLVYGLFTEPRAVAGCCVCSESGQFFLGHLQGRGPEPGEVSSVDSVGLSRHWAALPCTTHTGTGTDTGTRRMARFAHLWDMPHLSWLWSAGEVAWMCPPCFRTLTGSRCAVSRPFFPSLASHSLPVSSEDWAVGGLRECFRWESKDQASSDRKGFLLK